MSDPVFFRRSASPTVAEIATWLRADVPDGADLSAVITGIAPVDRAQPGTVTFLDNPRYIDQLRDTRASACLVGPKHRESVPPRCVALVVAEPQRAFADLVGRLYPEALRPGSVFGAAGIAPNSSVHPEARLEPGVTVDPGAVIGPRAEIGSGTVIGANAVIGPDVRIGRDCSIGPQSTVVFALIADRVIVHPGVRIGQDGFGFAMSARGHSKVPQIGRVIIQNDVEIGANTCIDRGHNRDTIIGEGTKIDNLVQIGHNVTVGRHCVIVSQTGISGSCDLADFVTLGGQAGLSGHLKIGQGAQIGAQSGVAKDVPVGAKWSGSPARPLREQYRMRAIVDRLLRESAARGKADRSEDES